MDKDISAKPDNLLSISRTHMEERDWTPVSCPLDYTLTVMNTGVDRYAHNWGEERGCVNINFFEEFTWINCYPAQLTRPSCDLLRMDLLCEQREAFDLYGCPCKPQLQLLGAGQHQHIRK